MQKHGLYQRQPSYARTAPWDDVLFLSPEELVEAMPYVPAGVPVLAAEVPEVSAAAAA